VLVDYLENAEEVVSNFYYYYLNKPYLLALLKLCLERGVLI
jgi:hypothetical protein